MIPPSEGFIDEVLRDEVGFMKPFAGFAFGHPDAFGGPVAGAKLGYADPAIGLGCGYATNRIELGIGADPRDGALRGAVASAIG